MKIKDYLKNKIEIIVDILRERYKKNKIRKLRNKDFTLVASNCNGGVILHDLNLKFNTPFINLSLPPKDFIKLTEKFEYYMSLDVKEMIDDTVNYPVGQLGDLRIDFMHYESFEEAKNKWNERKKRIDYNNLFFMLTERENCSFDDLVYFDKLPVKRKVVFTHKKYPKIKSSFYIHGFKNHGGIGLHALSELVFD